jgi:hypothetical protein
MAKTLAIMGQRSKSIVHCVFFTVTNERFGLLPEQPARLDHAALQQLANLVLRPGGRGSSKTTGRS